MRAATAIVISALTVGVQLSSQQSTAQPPPPLKPGAAIVLGKVVEAGTTSGIAGAVVYLRSPALGSPLATFTDGTPGGQRKVVTDAQGRFVFRDLPAGLYTFTAESDGYVDGAYGQQSVIVPSGYVGGAYGQQSVSVIVQRRVDLARSLQLGDADRPMNVTLSMWKMGGIAGKIVDEEGEPVVGVPVTIFALLKDGGEAVMQESVISYVTDDRGMYHADVAPGDYAVGVVVPTTTVPVSMVDGLNQALREGGDTQKRFLNDVTRNGSVLARGYGVRLGGFLVSQMPQNVPVVPPSISDDGRAWFYPTTFHPAAPTATSSAMVTVVSGEEKSGVDIRLRPAPARRVSGRITGPNGPIAGLGLRLYTLDQKMWRGTPLRVPGTAQAVCDPNGQFTFLGIPPGAYTLYAEQMPVTAVDPKLWVSVPLVVGDGDVSDLTLTLQPAARIQGRVVFETRGDAPPTSLRKNLQLVFRPVPSSGSASDWTLINPNLDEANGFATFHAVPGQYTLAVTNAPNWIVKSVSMNGRDVTDRILDVPATGIELIVTLTDQVSTLTGTVRDDAGQPAIKPTVIVFPVDRSLWPVVSLSPSRLQAVAPERNGSYAFRGLPAGEYFVVAIEWPGADFSDPNILTRLASTALRLTVNEGETKAQDLRSVIVR